FRRILSLARGGIETGRFVEDAKEVVQAVVKFPFGEQIMKLSRAEPVKVAQFQLIRQYSSGGLDRSLRLFGHAFEPVRKGWVIVNFMVAPRTVGAVLFPRRREFGPMAGILAMPNLAFNLAQIEGMGVE